MHKTAGMGRSKLKRPTKGKRFRRSMWNERRPTKEIEKHHLWAVFYMLGIV